MGKKVNEPSKHNKSKLSFQIDPTRSLLRNCIRFAEEVESKKKTSSSKILSLMHHIIARYKKKTRTSSAHLSKDISRVNKLIKVCCVCDKWSLKSDQMKRCFACKDYYHKRCLKSQGQKAFKQEEMCQNCFKIEEDPLQQQQQKQKHCAKCNKMKQKNQAFVQCLICKKSYHKQCYSKKSPACETCGKQIKEYLSKGRQLTLARPMNQQQKGQEEIDEKTQMGFANTQFNRLFPELNESQIEKYEKELIFAIKSKGMEYIEDLKAQGCKIQLRQNESQDFGLELMGPEERKIYNRYKKQPIGPFKLQFKQDLGYDVVADMDIRKWSLVCEYVGEVVTLRSHIQNGKRNDSLMDLKTGKSSQSTLIIRPQKYTNIGRFINGLRQQEAAINANVGSVRRLVGNKPVVLLFTTKNIRKGESLKYDYNSGKIQAKYDTSHFF